MRIIDAIERVDALKHNAYSESDKVEWLSRVDWMIKRHIIDTHEGGEDVEFSGYNYKTDIETELLVPEPHDDLYLKWIEAQIDYANGEYDKYNNSIESFRAVYDSYAKYYNRTHMPKGKKFKYF